MLENKNFFMSLRKNILIHNSRFDNITLTNQKLKSDFVFCQFKKKPKTAPFGMDNTALKLFHRRWIAAKCIPGVSWG
jgi:hypothetical protein